ncbi:MAG: pyrimidine-nucleoside phosphorylase [Clostridiales bacterium]|nr:pyrimidine-nucleoside phosphorylase [Clostridiales bacterium]
MRMYDVIEAKRDGRELTYKEIEYFINGYTNGSIPDYQAAALLMAIFLKGMNKRETADLTGLMAASGDTIDLGSIKGIKVDKHSTGGVGDKTTLVIGPIVAACGIPVAKMSGRGLGHTGGTVDKLEAIKGFHTGLTIDEFVSNVTRIGIAVVGQTGNLAPADKKLYAMRDVTATINSIPLIASSIMSKKIAAGADRILLDVKTGSGAFMKTLEDSIELASEMVSIGRHVGRETAALITDMDIPLGYAIGNSLEVIEAMDTLKGKGPEDFTTVSLELAAGMLELAGLGDRDSCRLLASEKIADGSALRKFKEMIIAQGGTYSDDPQEMFGPPAAFVTDVLSAAEGYIKSVKADSLGMASLVLGAGRETKESVIDHAAGIILHKKPGMKVSKGEAIATLYTNRQEKFDEARNIILEAVAMDDEPPQTRPLILAYVGYDKTIRY